MSTLTFRGDAQGRAQVTHVTPANPEPGDSFILTINRKDVTFLCDENTATVDAVCRGLAAAVGDFNNDLAEFAEISASVHVNDADEADYIILTGLSDGTPFTVTGSTSDAGAFDVEVTTLLEGSAGQNEIQRVRLAGPPTGGTFTLTFAGATTGAIARNANAAAVVSALEAISTIGVGDVAVTENSTSDWSIEFQATFANTNVPTLTGDGSSLTGAASVSVSTTTQGAPQSYETYTLTIDETTNQVYAFRFQSDENGGPYYSGYITNSGAGATAAAVQSALEGLLIGGDTQAYTSVEVTGPAGGPFTVKIISYGPFGSDSDLLSIDTTFYTSPGNSETITDEIVLTKTDDYDATNIDEVQVVSLVNGPTGGTFTLTFQGQITAGIAYNAAAATVQTALEGLSNIAVGDVVVTGNAGGPWTCSFAVNLGGTDLQEMTGSGASLTGGNVLISTTQQAAATANEQQSIALTGNPSGGTFTLTFNAETTGALDWDSTAAEILTALNGLTTPVPGDFTVTGGPGPDTPWLVTFTGAYAASDVASISGSGANLTGSGTQSLTVAANTTEPTGPNWWSEPENWSSGSAPVNGDTVILENNDVDILWGLNGLSGVTLAALLKKQSYTGKIGLPARNEAGFWEYRTQELTLGITALTIGEGDGPGSTLFRVNTGSVQTTILQYGSGQPEDTDYPAVLWRGTHAANVARIFKGSFGAAMFAGDTAVLATLEVGYLTDIESDAEVAIGAGCNLDAVNIAGGDTVADLLTNAVGAILVTGGTLTLTGAAAVSSLVITKTGYVYYNTVGTLGGNTVLADEGTLDFSGDMRAKAVTNAIELQSNDATVHDPFKVVSSLVLDLNYVDAIVNGSKLGSNVRLTRAVPS